MSTGTSIEWTDATWNPTRGCSRVSEGCRNCYAERIAGRFSGSGQRFERFARLVSKDPENKPYHGGTGAPRSGFRSRWTGVVELVPEKLDEPLRWRKPRRIFVNSMSDLFHESLPDEAIDQVFVVMAASFQRTRHTFQILTKRPRRMQAYMATRDRLERIYCAWRATIDWGSEEAEAWPLPNVWLGVSVEDQATADERIPLLLQTPAAVRFVSYEPALGPVDFGRFVPAIVTHQSMPKNPQTRAALQELARAAVKHAGWATLDWVIVGGESGPGARPFNAEWARSTVKQCKAAGVAAYVKQMGSYVRDRNDRLATDRPAPYRDMWPEPECGWDDGPRGNWEELDTGYQGAPVRVRLKSSKGGDPQEWPSDLRVREFPL